MTERRWIWRTIRDPEATEGEVLAAWAAATPAERRGMLEELELEIAWKRGLQRDIDGGLAHLEDQYPELAGE